MPLAVVEPFDVVEHVMLRVGARGPRRVVRQLDLQRREELSATALSQQLPRRLMLQTIPWARRARR